jgi:lactate dehydrogenase-like 2-hydroxyacid dehydrogenase
MTDHLLLMSANLEPHLDSLNGRCEIHRYYNAPEPDVLLSGIGKQVRLLGTNGHVGCAPEVMDRLPNLGLIGCFGVGYDAIDLNAARSRGISVTNTPEVLNDAVAELALGLMFALARRIPQSDRHVREGRWLQGEYPLTNELTGRVAGIVGMGRIGKELARRLQAMKMRVVYHGRHLQANEPFEHFDNLEAMAAAVDWLIVCLPGGASTDGIVSQTVLDALGPKGQLVNVARGSVVDQPALVTALEQGRLGGAALDVFVDEPRVPEPLIAMDNVVLSPHAASATHKTRHDMGELVIANMLAFLDGNPLISQVA